MKTHLIILCLLLLMLQHLKAQLNYEGKIDPRLKTIRLDDGEYKFYRYDNIEKTLLIWNIDSSLWKSVKLPLPEYHLLDKVKHISTNLFNDDNEIEIIYTCVVYHPRKDPDDPVEGVVEKEITLNIINELGQSILEVKNSNEFEILDTQQGRKLLIHKHQGNHREHKPETLVYSFSK